MCVCVCVNFFSVKDFSGTTVPRILKFGTNIGYDKLYCVLKNQPNMAYQFLYLSIFLSNKFFHHISLESMSARVFKFCIHDEDDQVYYCEQNQGAVIYFCLLFLFLANLSQRLIGELIVYPWSVVRRRPQCSNIFFSETSWPIKAKFYVEPPWVGGTKFCSRHVGHMTKMAATPIYGKNPSKIFFSRTGGSIFTKLGM